MQVLASLLVLPVSVALRGWVLMCFWKWFVVPVFHLPALGIMQAVGLSVAAMAFTASTGWTFRMLAVAKAVGAEEPGVMESAIQSIIHPLVVLVCGWAIHLFL